MIELEAFIGFQLKRLWICWARGSLVVKNVVLGWKRFEFKTRWGIAQFFFLHAMWCKLASPKTDHQIPWMAKSDAWTCSIPGFCKNTCETSAVAAAPAIGGHLASCSQEWYESTLALSRLESLSSYLKEKPQVGMIELLPQDEIVASIEFEPLTAIFVN